MQWDAWLAAALTRATALWDAALTQWSALPPLTQALIALALAAALGALLTAAPLRARLRALRADLSALDADRRALDREVASLAARTERLATVEAEADALRARLDAALEHRAALEAELRAERQSHAARLAELRAAETRLSATFDQLATGALDRNAAQFLARVTERFEAHKTAAEADLEARRRAIEALVTPVRETLGKFETQVGALEKSRAEAYGDIRTLIGTLTEGQRQLRGETGRLVQALRAPKTRGRWGEFQLRQVFEMAGMLEHVDFDLEPSHDTDAGRRRPDARVRLPGGKTVVVDAKTPLDAYLTALEAEPGSPAQDQALTDHARQLKAHVKGLAAKDYWNALPETPDFVVMFIPGEAFYSAAVERDPSLFEEALSARVLICSPTTLIALVKSIAYGWQQERLAENAQKVAAEARSLYDRLRGFGEHMDGLGRGLRQAVDRYNKAVGTLEARVLPAARRFETLSVLPPDAALPSPAPVEDAPRSLNAPEYATPELKAEDRPEDGAKDTPRAAE